MNIKTFTEQSSWLHFHPAYYFEINNSNPKILFFAET